MSPPLNIRSKSFAFGRGAPLLADALRRNLRD